jgi:hypothetical protein
MTFCRQAFNLSRLHGLNKQPIRDFSRTTCIRVRALMIARLSSIGVADQECSVFRSLPSYQMQRKVVNTEGDGAKCAPD